jgi:hypothetical protein
MCSFPPFRYWGEGCDMKLILHLRLSGGDSRSEPAQEGWSSLTLRLVGYIVTQPALDDVPAGFYPSSETEDEVSFASTSLPSCGLGAPSLTALWMVLNHRRVGSYRYLQSRRSLCFLWDPKKN